MYFSEENLFDNTNKRLDDTNSKLDGLIDRLSNLIQRVNQLVSNTNPSETKDAVFRYHLLRIPSTFEKFRDFQEQLNEYGESGYDLVTSIKIADEEYLIFKSGFTASEFRQVYSEEY